MKKLFTWFVLVFILLSQVYSQELPTLKSKSDFSLKGSSIETPLSKYSKLSLNKDMQVKKRKTISSYYGAGYSFVIFTAKDMNEGYPVFDTRKGDFLSEINLYFGFSIARALTLEIEPSLLFTNNDRAVTFFVDPAFTYAGQTSNYVTAYHLSMLSLIPVVNARFFPFYTQTTSFARLFFIGGGAGAAWIKEDYDYYLGQLNYYGSTFFTGSTSQWQPVLRVMTGFTGSGGQFGFGGELRYNIIPLSQNNELFITRTAPNFNSVDLTLRFYFSL
ncbi:MAG: hypothetical protein EHM58_10580 [Ignavibacteriae bacterium]|nr:MAG: hypothetical protein EHM58_10580 [Ignavibacteriota bacterium]